MQLSPVRDWAAGGYLLKQRNGVGDYVVCAPEFFRENGVDETVQRAIPVQWNAG